MAQQILVVDDSDLSRALIKKILERQGYSVLTASEGAEGAVVALRDHPDAVVTDLEMPVMDGYQLARLLKSDPATSDIPLLILTSHGEASSRFWGLETGADAYLIKDELAGGLVPMVDKLLVDAADRTRLPAAPPKTPLEVLARVSRHLDSRLLEAVLVNRLLERGMGADDLEEAGKAALGVISDFIDTHCLLLGLLDPPALFVYVKPSSPLPEGAQSELVASLRAKLGAADDAELALFVEEGAVAGEPIAKVRSPVDFSLPMRDVSGLLSIVPRRPFGPDSREYPLIEELGVHLALVLDNARLAQRLRELSMIDGLTRVLNRRTVNNRFAEEVERAKRYGHPLSVVLCDLDYFKRINDTHGHQAGDAVLVQVAEIFERQARAVDVVGRYGGEEFILLLPNTTLDSAVDAARRLLRAIAEHPFAIPDGSTLQVTASIGTASIGELSAGVSADALVALADARLYEAKEAGRNRAVP